MPWRIAITDPSRVGWIDRAVDLLRRDSVDLLQLRAHELADDDYAQVARRLADIAPQKLIVNGRHALAMELGALGLHLRSGDPVPAGARPTVYRACHTMVDLLNASIDGVDVAVFSPIFGPRSKPDARPTHGIEGLRAACAASSIPIVALGGMDDVRHRACLQAGAAGSAGIDWFFGDLPRR